MRDKLLLAAIWIFGILGALAVDAYVAHGAELTENRDWKVSTTIRAQKATQPVAYGSEIAVSPTDPTDIVTYIMTRSSGSGGTTLPDYNQVATQVLHSRAGSLFWGSINEVPDGPGTSSGVGRVLTVTGEGDQDYAFRDVNVASAVANYLAANPPSGSGGSATIPDNSITPGKAQAGTAAQQRSWRNRLASSRIGQVSAALPAVTDYNAGDLLIIGRGGTTTVTFVDLNNPTTQLTTTVAGDLVMVLSNRWTRVGNLFSGGIAAAAARAIADANKAILDRKFVFGSIQVTPPGIPDKDFPEHIGITLANKLDSRTIAQIQVSINGESVATVNEASRLAPFNGYYTAEPAEGQPG